LRRPLVLALVLAVALSGCGTVARSSGPSSPPASDGAASHPASGPPAQHRRHGPHRGEGATVLVRNRTTSSIWVYTAFGNRASIAPGGSVLELCRESAPFRAESFDGDVLAYLGRCTKPVWRIDSLRPVATPAGAGTVVGTLHLRTPGGSEPVRRAGIVFRGPVVRAAQVRWSGRFRIALPPGRYRVTARSSAIPAAAGVTDCPASPVNVTTGRTLRVGVVCG
jgi:hypothetical protein